jgi:hypothetical protein
MTRMHQTAIGTEIVKPLMSLAVMIVCLPILAISNAAEVESVEKALIDGLILLDGISGSTPPDKELAANLAATAQDALLALYTSGQDDLLVKVMERFPPAKPSGQVMVNSLSRLNYKPAEVHRLILFFETSMRWPDDREVGGRECTSYTLRYYLGIRLLGLLDAGRLSNYPGEPYIGNSPRNWVTARLLESRDRVSPEVRESIDRALEILQQAQPASPPVSAAPQRPPPNPDARQPRP